MEKKMKKNLRWRERGNVLFLILIAVALFAALSYAVTSSSRSGGGDAGGETSLINSAQVTQYPASVRTAIIRMLVKGVSNDDLLFNNPSEFSAALTTDTLRSQAVFHPSGGGATYVTAPAEVMEDGQQGVWFFNSEYEIEDIGTSEIGAATSSASNDIIAFLPGIKRSICVKLNEQLGISDSNAGGDGDDVGAGPTTIPSTNQNVANSGIGSAAAATHEIANDFAGQAYGCYDADDATNSQTDDDYVYFHVLVER